MIDRPVIPDSQIVHVAPLVPHLQVMILHDEIGEPVEEMLRLFLGKPVDLLYVVTDGEDTLPAANGVGADDRMDRFEDVTDVLGRAAFIAVQLETIAFGSLSESRLSVCGCQTFKELLKWWRNTIKQLIARSPERI